MNRQIKAILCVILVGLASQANCWWVYQNKALSTTVVGPKDRVGLDFFDQFDFSQEKEEALEYPVAQYSGLTQGKFPGAFLTENASFDFIELAPSD